MLGSLTPTVGDNTTNDGLACTGDSCSGTAPECKCQDDGTGALECQDFFCTSDADCGGGTCELSIKLAEELFFAGHDRVAVYMGGFPEWVEAGYATTSGEGH